MSTRLVVLDRDGVINYDSPNYIKRPEEWEALPGSLDAISRLCRADYQVVLMTNQSGIGRGLYSINTLNRIHQKMLAELQPLGGEIKAIFFCPHGPDEGCECRKPKPGMFHELQQRLKCSLKGVYAVGDSRRDLEAASAAGAKPVLVETGNGEKTLQQIGNGSAETELKSVAVHRDLAAFADWLLAKQTTGP